jgi:hypothetical protein
MSSKDLSLRQQIFSLLNKNHELKPKDICKLMDLDYKQYHSYVGKTKTEWKAYYRNRQALKCLSFHNTRAWVYALRIMDRVKVAVEGKGWLQTRAKNRMLLWKDPKGLGRIEWHTTGRVNLWIKKPATIGRIKQLLANAFFATGIISDIQIFDLWANSIRLKGSHVVYDTGEKLPYARIDFLKESLGVIAKMGDVTHPTSLELEFVYPDFQERAERLMDQNMKIMDLNAKALETDAQALKNFSEFMKDLSQSKPQKPEADKSMIV